MRAPLVYSVFVNAIQSTKNIGPQAKLAVQRKLSNVIKLLSDVNIDCSENVNQDIICLFFKNQDLHGVL